MEGNKNNIKDNGNYTYALDVCRAAILRYCDLFDVIPLKNISLNIEQYLSVVQAMRCIEYDLRKSQDTGNTRIFTHQQQQVFLTFFHIWQRPKHGYEQILITAEHQKSIHAITAEIALFPYPEQKQQDFLELYSFFDDNTPHVKHQENATQETEKNQQAIRVIDPLTRLHIDTAADVALYGPSDFLPITLQSFITSLAPHIKNVANDFNLRPTILNKIESNSMKHEVFHENINVSALLSESDKLTSSAKRWGLKIVETLHDPQKNMSTITGENSGFMVIDSSPQKAPTNSPFVVINHGTTKEFFTPVADEKNNGVLHILGQELRDSGRDHRTFMINDGPGSKGHPESLQSFVNPKTGSLITIQWPSNIRRLNLIRGALTGYGLNHTTKRVIKQLLWLDFHRQLPTQIALIGFSRGGAENHYLSNAIKIHFGETITLDLFSIDPVPGGLDILNVNAYKLPSIVKSATIFLAEKENRSLFQAIDRKWLKLESPNTEVSFFGLPDNHNNLRMKQTTSGRWVGNALADFLVDHKILDAKSGLYKNLHLPVIEKMKLEVDIDHQRTRKLTYVESTTMTQAVNRLTSWTDYFSLSTRTITDYLPINPLTLSTDFAELLPSKEVMQSRKPKLNLPTRPTAIELQPLSTPIRKRTMQLNLKNTHQLLVQHSARFIQEEGGFELEDAMAPARLLDYLSIRPT